MVENLPANTGGTDSTPGSRGSPEKGTAAHSSVLAGVPWTEEPGGLQSLGSLKSHSPLSN